MSSGKVRQRMIKTETIKSLTPGNRSGVQKARRQGTDNFISYVQDPSETNAPQAMQALFESVFDPIIQLQSWRHQDEVIKNQISDLLTALDSVKKALISQDDLENCLKQLKNYIKKQEYVDVDPRLSNLLQEVDLRAQIELAKWSSTRENFK